MKYRVKATSQGKTRTEIINTKTNVLFKNVKTSEGVKRKYENFWNFRYNKRSKKVLGVRVIKVTRVRKK